MAIQTLSFINLIIRPWVEQEISSEGWAFLLNHTDPNRNYDGEIMAFGAMSNRDIDGIINRLTSSGYNKPDMGEDSDMVISSVFDKSYMPPWIELVDVTFFDDTLPPVKAWKKKNSEVYKLLNFESDITVPTKGYDCDWPPHIGKIE